MDARIFKYALFFILSNPFILAWHTLILSIFLDIFIQRNRFSPKDRNTDWFYNNEHFDRKMDSRADTNQYKIK